jgi:hypothetical protein
MAVNPLVRQYGLQDLLQREAEKPPETQDIAEVAHFLDYDGLIVPSARFDCLNVVAFCDRLPPDALVARRDHGQIDWDQV